MTTFAPHMSPTKTEYTEDLGNCLTKAIKGPGAIKMSHFKKGHDCDTAVKENTRLEAKVDERK